MTERHVSVIGKGLIGLGLAGGIVYSVSVESSEDSELRSILGEDYPAVRKLMDAGFCEADAVSLAMGGISLPVSLEWRDSGIPAEYQFCYIDNKLDKRRAKLIYDGLGVLSSHYNVSAYVDLSDDDIRQCMSEGFIGHRQMLYVNSTKREDGSVDIEAAKKWRSAFSPVETKELAKAGLSFEQAREACEKGKAVTVEGIKKYFGID